MRETLSVHLGLESSHFEEFNYRLSAAIAARTAVTSVEDLVMASLLVVDEVFGWMAAVGAHTRRQVPPGQ